MEVTICERVKHSGPCNVGWTLKEADVALVHFSCFCTVARFLLVVWILTLVRHYVRIRFFSSYSFLKLVIFKPFFFVSSS